MDGLIDIARANVTPNTITSLQLELIQRLATAIVNPIAPAGFNDEPKPSQLFGGRVALAVYPLQSLVSPKTRRVAPCE